MKKLIFLLLLSGLAHAEQTAELSVDEIISKANAASYYAGEDGRSDARMMIVDAAGNKQLRQFVILRQNLKDSQDQNFLVIFSRPADVKGTGFLVHKKANQDDNRWLYLPALDLEKRIAAGDNRSSFVGSDFFYEDVSGRHPNADEHLLESQDEQFYYLRNTPKQPDSVEFKYYTVKIDKQTWLPMLIQYYDQKDKLYRQVETVKVETVQGYPTVMQSKVSNFNSGGYTIMAMRNPKYNLGLQASDFTVRSLRKPPKQWVK